jgi:ABC-2 type transport system permease protein
MVGTVFFCSWFVMHGVRNALSYAQPRYFNMVLHEGNQLLVMMWILTVTLLMMGGLLREKTAGSSAFTLALPVKRTRLMRVRIAVGLMQAVALAVLPWASMYTIGRVFGKTHSFYQAGFHLVLLLGGGMVFFAAGVLISSLVEGEYTAPILSVGVVMATLVLDKPSWRDYNPLLFMMGDRRASMGLLKGPVPWLQAGMFVLVAAALLVVSVKAIQRREF